MPTEPSNRRIDRPTLLRASLLPATVGGNGCPHRAGDGSRLRQAADRSSPLSSVRNRHQNFMPIA
jgi:hypothetical protein